MSRIKAKDTKPEILVRTFLHKHGFRFRIHRADLPGKPDIVLAKYKTVIFVHGCYWHRHQGCKNATTPKTRKDFWEKKFEANIERDKRKIFELISAGWNVIIIWECEVNDQKRMQRLPTEIRLKR